MPHFSAGRKAPTIFGWTPGLRRLVSGQRLECGCLIGVYETKRREVVKIIDHLAAPCTVSNHAVNLVLDAETSTAAPVATVSYVDSSCGARTALRAATTDLALESRFKG